MKLEPMEGKKWGTFPSNIKGARSVGTYICEIVEEQQLMMTTSILHCFA